MLMNGILNIIYIMRINSAPKDEDQRQRWHLSMLADVIEDTTDLTQLLAHELSSMDRSELAQPMRDLVIARIASETAHLQQ